MFTRKTPKDARGASESRHQAPRPLFIESLEDRILLSTSAVHYAVHAHVRIMRRQSM